MAKFCGDACKNHTGCQEEAIVRNGGIPNATKAVRAAEVPAPRAEHPRQIPNRMRNELPMGLDADDGSVSIGGVNSCSQLETQA